MLEIRYGCGDKTNSSSKNRQLHYRNNVATEAITEITHCQQKLKQIVIDKQLLKQATESTAKIMWCPKCHADQKPNQRLESATEATTKLTSFPKCERPVTETIWKLATEAITKTMHCQQKLQQIVIAQNCLYAAWRRQCKSCGIKIVMVIPNKNTWLKANTEATTNLMYFSRCDKAITETMLSAGHRGHHGNRMYCKKTKANHDLQKLVETSHGGYD